MACFQLISGLGAEAKWTVFVLRQSVLTEN